ncbi:prepilin-type N-terminal cleavage/methylation domain-containing protein [Bacillus sp. V3B]|uniref:competence type IV pilus major pilin ComGC n=1 Tax=Bacillus sp. V3B TaxID=2804915 RepID=UPI002108E232|nr:competence type IV pilus major pilin ComGC [Bacillus sp. V3B]MCQ6273715.1 prepilin-type N-terminal cleavage/methylation domain-containing protein [Bacillus sp. V3B]
MLKNEKGFTLIEMMIVLLVISVLLMITVPNVTKHNSSINEKGCEAYEKMVQGQVQAYEMEHHQIPTVDDLVAGDYLLNGETECPAGKSILISADGIVTLVDIGE